MDGWWMEQQRGKGEAGDEKITKEEGVKRGLGMTVWFKQWMRFGGILQRVERWQTKGRNQIINPRIKRRLVEANYMTECRVFFFTVYTLEYNIISGLCSPFKCVFLNPYCCSWCTVMSLWHLQSQVVCCVSASALLLTPSWSFPLSFSPCSLWRALGVCWL